MFKQGFTFGKYYPLHKGHLALIRYAKNLCEHLSVFVCASATESIDGQTRVDWLEKELMNQPDIDIVLLPYDESVLPNTSVSDRTVSALWARVFHQHCPYADLLVTSERYGDYVAASLGIKHIPFDLPRTKNQISASAIRQNLMRNWEYLPAVVKRSLQKVVVISGAESTGKSTLAREIANSFQGTLVEEIGRIVIPHSSSYTLSDLHRTAIEHAQAITASKAELNWLVVVDTDVYTTQSYAHFALSEYLNLPEDIYQANAADLRLFLTDDVPFIQDGTRMPEGYRKRLGQSHLKAIYHFQQQLTVISGADWNTRLQQAKHLVAQLANVSCAGE